jgi:hypothetical protein
MYTYVIFPKFVYVVFFIVLIHVVLFTIFNNWVYFIIIICINLHLLSIHCIVIGFFFLAWWPSWLEVGFTGHKFRRGPSKDHSTKVWFKLALWLQRSWLKCEKLTDGRTFSGDNSSPDLWVRWATCTKLKIEKRGDAILIVHCCFSISQNELKF